MTKSPEKQTPAQKACCWAVIIRAFSMIPAAMMAGRMFHDKDWTPLPELAVLVLVMVGTTRIITLIKGEE